MKLKIGYRSLIDSAMAQIETIPLDQAKTWLSESNTVFVDIRELERDGMIPNAIHAPRGMLEFWVDPESPYYKPIFGEETPSPVLCVCLAIRVSGGDFTKNGLTQCMSLGGWVWGLEKRRPAHCRKSQQAS